MGDGSNNTQMSVLCELYESVIIGRLFFCIFPLRINNQNLIKISSNNLRKKLS